MRAVVQRVTKGSVLVEKETVASIGDGLMVLLGIEKQDTQKKADCLAKKIANLRIFADDVGKMNLSLIDIHGSAIVVSQFTLMADTHKGNRPSFFQAASPHIALELVDYFIGQLRGYGIETQNGIFGAHMKLNIQNDGPVTIILEY